MSEVINWTCPYCNHDTTLGGHNFEYSGTHFTIQNPIDGHAHLNWFYVVCPNPECRRFYLNVSLYEYFVNKEKRDWEIGKLIKSWNLIPSSKAKTFPDYIPIGIINDYNEACLIVETSPKASATLSRRCLQGILRDFWLVKPGRLVDEIEQIKDKTDPLTWEAIDSVRKIGNIGAHMEEDINLIIDVDPNEAEIFIGLIETLVKDWYIVRKERKNQLNKIKEIAQEKEDAKNLKIKDEDL
jgi:hypothetical protein